MALIYAVICLGVIGFQVALIAGAPWGRLTQGGAHTGPLPRRNRVFAALSAFILAAMALAILSAAGGWPDWPRWTGWGAVAGTSLTTLANLATPSVAERRLWAPITGVMLILALAVMLTG